MLRRVALVSEERSASFIRVPRIVELGTMLAVTSNRRTLRRYTNTTSLLCQNIINLTVDFPIRRIPNIFMNVQFWEYPNFNCEILDVAKFTTVAPLICLISCKFDFQLSV
jgi:hypothetical protein